VELTATRRVSTFSHDQNIFTASTARRRWRQLTSVSLGLMLPDAIDIQGSDEALIEMADLLEARGIDSERRGLALNAVGAGIVEFLSVAATPASIAIVGAVLVAYIRRDAGQRKIVVQWLDQKEERLKRVEVESPRADEIPELLKKAERVFLIDSKEEKT